MGPFHLKSLQLWTMGRRQPICASPIPPADNIMTNTQNARRRAAVALLIAAGLVACQADSPVAPWQASFSVLGSTDAAQACQNSGYQSLRRADGSEFKNIGDCVRYV